MSIKEIKISQFDGGMAEKQSTRSNQMSMLENFDLGNNPEYLKPFVSLNSNTGGFSTSWGVTKVVFSNNAIYGLGIDGSQRPQIYKLSSILDATNSSWSAPASAVASSGVVDSNFFTVYKNYIYLFNGSDKISRYGDLSGSPTFTTAWQTFAQSVDVTSDGIVGKDDNLYFAYRWSTGTKTAVAKITTSLTEAVITVPTNKIINQIVAYGNFLGLICSSNDGENSTLYLWDYVSSDVTESIDLGAGEALAGEVIGGNLIITILETGFANTPSRPSFIRVISYSGGSIRTLFRVKPQSGSTNTTLIDITSPAYSYRGNMYLGVLYTREGQSTYSNGILRIGRKDETKPISYSFDFNVSSNTNGIGVSDFLFYQENFIALEPITTTTSNAYITYNNANYISSSVYETGILNVGDGSVQKELRSVAVYFNPLISGGQVILKYRKDEETTWTTIFTETTLNSMFHESVSIESTGASLPIFKYIQFRIESTGGAEILGLKMKSEDFKSIY